jgi:hypothetical protein
MYRRPGITLAGVVTGLVAALICLPTLLAAREHPGHGSKVVLGPLVEVTRDAIVVEARDAGGGTTRVRVLLQPDTRFRIDKERLTSLDGMIGQRAIVSVDWEDDDRGGQTLKATEVRFTRAKKGSGRRATTQRGR